MKSMNNLSLVKTTSKRSLIEIISNRIQVEGKESSFLLILCDCPVGGSSVGGRLSTFFEE